MAISWTNNNNTATLNVPSPLSEVLVSSALIQFTIPTVQAKLTGSYLTPPFYLGLGRDYTTGSGWGNYAEGIELRYGNSALKYLRGQTSVTVNKDVYADINYNNSAAVSLPTSTYFNSSNASTRSINFTLVAPYDCMVNAYEPSIKGNSSCRNPAEKTLSTIKVTLNAPPTFDTTPLSFDTNYKYTGLTTASVTVSNLSAKYGGSITDVTLAIGSQTASRSDAGELSILLQNVGTFNATVTVTDSRGQTKTTQLGTIRVEGYNPPAVAFTAERTTSAGVADDEGNYATVDATFTFTDVVVDAVAPSVVVTDENGTQTTPTVTWYTTRASDGTLSGALSDWSNLSSGDTVYGLIPNVNTQYSYQISVRPRDSQGTGTAITQTLSSAFYTIDFLAGGHGIAFGKPASDPGFECAMTALFEETVQVDGTATFNDDILIDLSNYQVAGSVDKELYDAIVALGWDSDVLIN